jgi:hypothetical protein
MDFPSIACSLAFGRVAHKAKFVPQVARQSCGGIAFKLSTQSGAKLRLAHSIYRTRMTVANAQKGDRHERQG